MIKIIDGKRYNTETAEKLCQLASTNDSGSFDWHETYLYRTRLGRFFVAGHGNARSMWAETVSQNTWGSGSGLRAISEDEALGYLEEVGATEYIEKYFDISDA